MPLEPVVLPTPTIAVACGEHHTMLLTAAGDVYTLGSNREGQLGCGEGTAAAPPSTPVLAAGPSAADPAARARVVAIAAGARHSLALTEDGGLGGRRLQSAAWGTALLLYGEGGRARWR